MTPAQIKVAFADVTRAQLRAALEMICTGVNYGGCSKRHMLEMFPAIATGRPHMTDYSLPITLPQLVEMVLAVVVLVRRGQQPGGFDRQPRFHPDDYRYIRDLIRNKYNWGEDPRHKLGYKKP